MMARTLAVADTSVFIAQESGRPLGPDVEGHDYLTTVVTVGELELGVLVAADVQTRARRLATLDQVRGMPILSASEEAAHEWARLRAYVGAAGRRVRVNDLWIAAIAAANRLPVVTQDADFDLLADAPGVEVIRV
ncbi:PIN domain-containing protein [Microbacterium sp. X-17]|uniref:PIN domain-containing protein n=1 Tax=Microbacterium sp. X-17 TaxID=3144404 RepID=UPI0031F577FE